MFWNPPCLDESRVVKILVEKKGLFKYEIIGSALHIFFENLPYKIGFVLLVAFVLFSQSPTIYLSKSLLSIYFHKNCLTKLPNRFDCENLLNHFVIVYLICYKTAPI